jgi:hypothetical protein
MDILDILDEHVADKRRVEVTRVLLGYRGRYTHDEGGNESRRLDIRDVRVGERSEKGCDGDQAIGGIDRYGEDGRCEEYAALDLVERGVVLARSDRKKILAIPVAADEGQNSFGVSKATSGVNFRITIRESAGDEVEIWISQIIRSIDWAVECPIGGGVHDAGDVR